MTMTQLESARKGVVTEAMKTVAARPTNSYHYGNGAIHDDRRSQFMLGEERANMLQQKQMTEIEEEK